MKFLGFRLTVDGWVDSFELRQAAIEAARLAHAAGSLQVRLVELRQCSDRIEWREEMTDDVPPWDAPFEVSVEWQA